MGHISEKGHVSDFHNRLSHEPIAVEDAMKILDAQAAVDKEWINLKRLPAGTSRKPKSEVVPQAKHDLRLLHLTSLVDLCHPQHSELGEHLHIHTRGESCAGEQRQRRRWIQTNIHGARHISFASDSGKKSWIQFPDSLSWQERPTTRYQLKRRCTCHKPQIYCECQKRDAQKCVQDYRSNRRPKQWRRD